MAFVQTRERSSSGGNMRNQNGTLYAPTPMSSVILKDEESRPSNEAQDEFSSTSVSDLPPPDRSSSASAPPLLESSNLFASNNRFANIFSGQFDIRATEDYYQFYHEYGLKFGKLPPPLEPAPFVFDNIFEEDSHMPSVPNGTSSFGKFFQDPYGRTEHQQHPNLDVLNNEAAQQLQGLSLGMMRSPNVNIPSPSTNIWNPAPKRINHINSGYAEDITTRVLQPGEISQKDLLQLSVSEHGSYSSSPSAQTAIKAAQFIFGGEDQDHNNFNNTPKTKENFFDNANNESRDQDNEVAPNPSQSSGRSNIICRYYTAGYCSRGDKCYYSHDTSQNQNRNDNSGKNRGNKPKSPRPAQQYNSSNGNGTQNSNHNQNQNNQSPNGPRGHVNPLLNPAPLPVLNSNVPMSGPSNPSSLASILGIDPSKLLDGDDLSPRSSEFYANFDQLIGKIYMVSKDQQGCRFLQKKLEEQDPKTIEIIFNEVYDHITELMTDPFGNYLCQKLLEHCSDLQRYKIVERVAPDLVNISKNMHGTRAVQKMIECLSSPPQIELIKRALGNSVVELIQDLNGNHVIQRCLHRLSAEDNNQFIYNAVTTSNNCVQVATHRHGCCVLQRCIDNASERQKVQLIQEIIKNALILVQDPYGNYVVQYVLILPFPNLVEALIQSFLGHLRELATQKFSSNVIEKTLSVATVYTRSLMIREIMQEQTLAVLLQDPYANYVVQTALTVSEPQQHQELVDAIRPFLNQLRNTPYGKRIQNKITKETNERAHGRRG